MNSTLSPSVDVAPVPGPRLTVDQLFEYVDVEGETPAERSETRAFQRAVYLSYTGRSSNELVGLAEFDAELKAALHTPCSQVTPGETQRLATAQAAAVLAKANRTSAAARERLAAAEKAGGAQ